MAIRQSNVILQNIGSKPAFCVFNDKDCLVMKWSEIDVKSFRNEKKKATYSGHP